MRFFIKKIILITLLLIGTEVFANVAKVVAFSGKATIVRESNSFNLSKNSTILKNDEIITKENTKVQLLFKDETIISIGKNSNFKVLDYLYDEKNKNYDAEFGMIKGTFRTITGKIGKFAPKRFNLKTKSASIGIRGTQIVMNLTEGKEDIFCTEGKIQVEKIGTNLKTIVNAGQFVSLDQNTQTLEVKQIKQSDINSINKEITIKKNLATDNITLESKENIIEEDKNVETTTNSTQSNSDTNDDTSSDNTNTEDSTESTSTESNNDSISDDSSSSPVSSDSTNNNETIDININLSSDDDEDNTDNDLVTDALTELTPASFFEDNNSIATYKGDFNNYSYDSEAQYMKKDLLNVKIPSNTSISMDIDFGATNNHISNGKIEVSDTINNYYDTTFEFEGRIKNNSNFSLKGINDTKGAGSGNFYGTEAQLIKGQVDFESAETNVKIKGSFDADKQ